jgi:hypothetical protein
MVNVDVSNWWCPVCEHGMIAYYDRPWRRAFRKTYWRGCVACDHRERWIPSRLATTIGWPTFVIGVVLLGLVMTLVVYGLATYMLVTR